ncbi:hypothetical protein RCH12_002789 [Cryobacterium sp. MP_3.1]|uniref:glycoside hydrolase family 25 protein n=1 Tax=Cryobacterium sp. MP_3.1 TaxID=3071711 RepID=UPI002E00E7C1|nr:hypothetical protein [Cryobacterium sp. MP_3.1]
MTFGIDVSSGQAGINYNQARNEGVEFVIVKASGNNIGLYEANSYHAHVDAARAAGLRIGHYFVVGRGNPTAQANYFVDHLYKFDGQHDVLAFDNEPLDSNATFFGQAAAYEFLAQVQRRTGISWNRLWLYAPASLTRSHTPWSRITDAGVRIWWAAYGGQPTGRTPDHEPALNRSVSRWDVHQFTSSARIAGHTVDGNYSKISASDLFGGGGSTIAAAGTQAPAGRRRTSTEEDGEPGSIYWTMVQAELAVRGWYPGGTIDGEPGAMTHHGHARLQAAILNEGRGELPRTSTEEDGAPGGIFWLLAQTEGREYGYGGDIDRVPGPNTIRALYKLTAAWLNRHGR